MAVYRPRTFVVEAGNSFGLLADYAERFGLTVNRITLAQTVALSYRSFQKPIGYWIWN